MRYFMKKVYGSNPSGPLKFSEESWLDDALRKLTPRDRVVFVGTQGKPTAAENRGRILGMVEPTRQPIILQDSRPFALESRRAWRCLEDPLPLFRDICKRPFSRTDASRIVELFDDEVRQIRRLRFEAVEVLAPSVQAQPQLAAEAARRRAAPPPTTTRRGVMHMRREPAFTYAFRIRGTAGESFKIGWAFDHDARRRQLNMVSLPSLGGLQYTPHLHHRWDTAQQAFRMEQAVLDQFDAKRHPENHEVLFDVSQKELKRVWKKLLLRARRASTASCIIREYAT